MQHSAMRDREAFRAWLQEPDSDPSFVDPTNLRLRDVWRDCNSGGHATPLELAVLLRQVAQRWATMGPERVLITRDFVELLPQAAVEASGLVITRDGMDALVGARRWEPDWITNPANAAVDGSFAAGTETGWRQRPSVLIADPAFTAATGFSHYRSPGQRAAIRVVLESDPAGVVIADLPTGSGKTEVAVTLARSYEKSGGTCLMVVPTIALAQNLEDRFRAQWQKTTTVDLSRVPFAWTSATGEEDRKTLKDRIALGQQPILVTSPESLNTALLQTVRNAATSGRLRALIIDEAHLVTQWGRGFRPEYRLLGPLWRELNGSSPTGIRALLLSATLPSDVITDLVDLFPSELGPAVVAANATRTEPDFWVSDPVAPHVRDAQVLDALMHLPRPLVLYVTKPQFADQWEGRLRDRGFRRVVTVTGESSARHRQEALAGLRTGRDSSRFDIAIGTSAFGLGIDVGELRAVVHACVPETGDRWYQEVGRAGRDGYVSTALLIPADGDMDEALSLGVRALRPENAAERWETLWHRRKTRIGKTYVNLRNAPIGRSDGSYNRRWNAQILDAMQELGILKRRILSFDEARAAQLTQVDEDEQILRDAWQEISLMGPPPTDPFFHGMWKKWKERIERESYHAIEIVERFIRTRDACEAIRAAYAPSDVVSRLLGPDVAEGFGTSKPCGRCQACAEAEISRTSEPPPEPTLRWNAIPPESRLYQFVSARQFTLRPGSDDQYPGVAVVEGIEPNLQSLAQLLVRAGARLGAGKPLQPLSAEFKYFDATPEPTSMPPIPAVFALDEPSALRATLEQLQLRCSASGTSEAVVVLVDEVPRDLRGTRQIRTGDLRAFLEQQP